MHIYMLPDAYYKMLCFVKL